MTPPIFRRIEVWRPISAAKALRYNCLQSLDTGQYRVASADFLEGAATADQELYFADAVRAWDPADPEQPEWFEDLASAIAAHDAAFGN